MQTVWDHLRLAAARTPDHLAMVDDRSSRRWSFSELVTEIEEVAAGLQEAGLEPGRKVATLLPNFWEHAVAIMALQRLGVVACLINPRLKPEQARELIHRAGASAAICLPESVAAIRDGLPSGAPVYSVGGAVPGGLDFSECRSSAERLAPWTSPDPEAVALVMYTSGTTGMPKGVMIPHRTTDPRVLYVTTQCGLRHGTHNRALGLMPLFHAVGFYSAFLLTLSMNGTYFVHSAFDPAAALACMERERISFLYGAPAHFHALLANPGFSGQKVESVETLVYAGAAMPGPLLDRVAMEFRRARITNIYGTTEVMNALYMPDPAGRPLSYRPGFYSDVRIGRIGLGVHDLCAAGEEGEVLVDALADATFSGYLGQPEATAEKLVDGWYRTGDIGVWTDSGDLELRGRVDDMIVSGGENIHPEEVETVLVLHSEISEAAVIGIPDEKWTERVVACVVGGGVSKGDLDSWCRNSELADYKRPRDYVFMDALPRNAANKVLRRDLKNIASEKLSAV